MRNLIAIDDKEEYSLSEFLHIVKRALSAIANESPNCEFVYPGREVYFTIFDMLGYVNDRVPGEFKINQPKSRMYEIVYTDEKAARRKAGGSQWRDAAQTAKLLYEQTGEWPIWASKPEIQSILNNSILNDEVKNVKGKD